MKRFLLSFAFILGAFCAGAETIITIADYAATNFCTEDNICVTADKANGQEPPKYYSSSEDLRVYAKGTLTIEADLDMTSIVFTLSKKGKERLSEENTADCGTLEEDAEAGIVTWTGNARKVVITVGENATLGTAGGAAQLDFTALTIETKEDEPVVYFPVADPEIGDGRLVVCAQNTRNYFVVDLASGRSDYSDIAGLEDKTERMVKVFRHLDADIFALCELECQDSVLAYLTNAMNTSAGEELYAYVEDNQNVGEGQVKSGFMYRKDKVRPYGLLSATSSQQYYRYTMRVQAFEELATNERFVLSMNHFKAKDTTEDEGNAKRERNAQDLVSALGNITTDPDILLMGDLNCTISENPLTYILNAGYTEVLLAYDPNAYSHYYSGNQLIDHAFANATMTAQIQGAGVFHINTGTKKTGEYWYSDHDPVLVSMNLLSDSDPNPNPQPGECEPVGYQQNFKEGLGEFFVYTPQGQVDWYSNSYGAVINGYNKTAPMESWLISPEFHLQGAESATITFRHNVYYDNSNGQYGELQTLWYTTDYDEAVPTEATWQQITIPSYGIKSWADCTVDLPADALAANFRYAFKYVANSGAEANYWEIDNTTLTSACPKPQAIEETNAANQQLEVRKFVHDGVLYIQVGEIIYTILGEPARL